MTPTRLSLAVLWAAACASQPELATLAPATPLQISVGDTAYFGPGIIWSGPAETLFRLEVAADVRMLIVRHDGSVTVLAGSRCSSGTHSAVVARSRVGYQASDAPMTGDLYGRSVRYTSTWRVESLQVARRVSSDYWLLIAADRPLGVHPIHEVLTSAALRDVDTESLVRVLPSALVAAAAPGARWAAYAVAR